jgi:hypothetical protein
MVPCIDFFEMSEIFWPKFIVHHVIVHPLKFVKIGRALLETSNRENLLKLL